MIDAAVRTRGRYPAPTKITDEPALVEEFGFDADGTAYRVVIVSSEADAFFVLVEPTGWLGDARKWLALSRSVHNPLAVTYVAEKLGLEPRGQDAHNLTLLIAYAIGRPALVYDASGEFLERRVPA